MKIDFNSIEEKKIDNFKGGEKSYAVKMFTDPMIKIMKGRLIPGASIGLHTHDTSCEVFFFKSGHGYVLFDGQRIDVGPGDVHYCPKGHQHTLINDAASTEDLIFDAVVPEQ